MLHVVIPVHEHEDLTHCARQALRRTLARPHQVWVVPNDDPLLGAEPADPRNGSLACARKMDAVVAALPPSATWLVAMHNDSAPLASDWLDWLLAGVGEGVLGGFYTLAGTTVPHPLGAVYRVEWLRDTGASFLFPEGSEVSKHLPTPPVPAFLAQRPAVLPAWLDGLDVGGDEHGRILWGHLGGGTIGAWKHFDTWLPRRVAWPADVHRYLTEISVGP